MSCTYLYRYCQYRQLRIRIFVPSFFSPAGVIFFPFFSVANRSRFVKETRISASIDTVSYCDTVLYSSSKNTRTMRGVKLANEARASTNWLPSLTTGTRPDCQWGVIVV